MAKHNSVHAVVAELADAQDSGSCGRKLVEVQVLSTAPKLRLREMAQFFVFVITGN